MKKRIIFSAVITMLLCFCMIAGATYALFTSESKVDITVTSGKVEISAEITDLKLYSFDVEQASAFENGGTAVYADGVLKLENVTPGDKVEFNIYVKNNSNINIVYKTKWVVEGELSAALEAYIVTAEGDKALANVGWTAWNANAAEKEQVIKVKVELPKEAGNDFQGKSANITFKVEAIQANGLESKYATPSTLADILAAAEEGDEIQLAAGYYETIVAPVNGLKFFSTEDAVVGFFNLNSKNNITIEGLTFDAAGAQMTYDVNGVAKQYANIVGATGKGVLSGAKNIVIDGCKFEGTFAKGGASIAFVDQARTSGGSGNITITNCTFETKGAYYNIYGHYFGENGTFVVENNILASEFAAGGPIYLGRYQSSTPVVIKNNVFKTTASANESYFVQDHSNYGVSIDAANNTFLG